MISPAFLVAPIAYFLLVCLGLAFARHPTRRHLIINAGTRQARRFATALRHRFSAAIRSVHIGWHQLRNHRRHTTAPIRHRTVAIGGLALTVLPSLAVLALSPRTLYEFPTDNALPDRQISVLLAGERLTPPPSLAPAVFATAEVEMLIPYAGTASRDWNLLDDQFRQQLLTVFKVLKESYGYEAVLLEGYRSPERQAELVLRGPSVTQAGPNMSYHQHGLAADVAFLRNGTLVISERDPWTMEGYRLYGTLAEAAGLTWGGRWKMMDFGHVELRRRGILADKHS